MKQSTAWLFDVDGVLTDPEIKQVVQMEIFDEIIKRIKRNDPVGLNTGRSTNFVVEKILTPLEQRISDKHLLGNLSAYCEYGIIQITYSEEGQRNINIDFKNAIPQIVKVQIEKLINNPPYRDLVFFDTTKQTMITIELRPNKTIAQFQESQKLLEEELKTLLNKYDTQQNFRIESTTIATDIMNKNVDKAFGTMRFIDLLAQQKIEPNKYICFGDSLSDLAMLKALDKLHKDVVFVFVGDRTSLLSEDTGSIVFMPQLHDKGTLEYLQNYQLS